MNPPAGSKPSQPQGPSSQAPAPTPGQQVPSQNTSPSHSGGTAPRGEEFDISALPVSPISSAKKWFSPQWNRAWIGLGVLLAIYCVWLLAYGMGAHAQKPLPLPVITNSAAPSPTTVTVHVAGEVVRPGVYSLSANARISDAITQAGGLTPNAETTSLNMAGFVQDGAQIVVPARSVPSSNASVGIAPTAISSVPAPTATLSAAAATRAAQIDYLRAHPIDLNQATSFELQQLPGVGPAMAQGIIDYRTSKGRFRSISDLDNVKGIGEKRLQTLKDLVIVR